MKDGGIKISTIVVDGLDMNKASCADIKCFADFIKSEKMTAWFSFTNEAADLKGTLDTDKLENFTSVAHLAAEDPKHPLSDQKIAEILKDAEIDIARRTVAKYREAMGILSSSQRKKI